MYEFFTWNKSSLHVPPVRSASLELASRVQALMIGDHLSFTRLKLVCAIPQQVGLYSRETNLGKLLLASQDFYQGIVVFVCYILDQDL